MRKLEAPSVGAIGATLAEHRVLILVVLVAILVVLLVVVVIVSRRKTPQASGASAAPPPPPPPSVETGLLHRAWQRFVGRLPGAYQRSILNFEQFVVMGAP